MSTSGTVTYRGDRDTIIKGALRLCSAYDPENSAGPSTNQITFGAEALNMLVKAWEANGLQLWERKWGVVFPRVDQGVYVLGSPGAAGDHACLANPLGYGNFVSTTLSAAAASGASTVTLTAITSESSTGISVFTAATTHNIGIELDTGDLQWTTINGALSTNTATLTATLTGAAAAGNRVFVYATKMVRPLRILDGYVRQLSSNSDIPINVIPRENYNRFGIKTSTGTPVQLYYDPQRSAGYIYIYPVFSNVDQLLYIEFQSPIEDFSASTDEFDLPQEWGEALKFNLALSLAPEYEVTDTKFKQIAALATASFDLVNGYDQENASLFIQPHQMLIDSLR